MPPRPSSSPSTAIRAALVTLPRKRTVDTLPSLHCPPKKRLAQVMGPTPPVAVPDAPIARSPLIDLDSLSSAPLHLLRDALLPTTAAKHAVQTAPLDLCPTSHALPVASATTSGGPLPVADENSADKPFITCSAPSLARVPVRGASDTPSACGARSVLEGRGAEEEQSEGDDDDTVDSELGFALEEVTYYPAVESTFDPDVDMRRASDDDEADVEIAAAQDTGYNSEEPAGPPIDLIGAGGKGAREIERAGKEEDNVKAQKKRGGPSEARREGAGYGS